MVDKDYRLRKNELLSLGSPGVTTALSKRRRIVFFKTGKVYCIELNFCLSNKISLNLYIHMKINKCV